MQVVDSQAWTGREQRGGLADALAPLRKWLARCPVCKGAKVERIWSSQMIGDIHVPCSSCDGKGSLLAYEQRAAADLAWINRPHRCGCPECSGEWDRY